MREIGGSAAAPVVRRKNVRRGTFIATPSEFVAGGTGSALVPKTIGISPVATLAASADATRPPDHEPTFFASSGRLRLARAGTPLAHQPSPIYLRRRIQREWLHAEVLVGCSRDGIDLLCPDLIAASGVDPAKRRVAKSGQRASFACRGEAKGNVKLLL